MSKTLHPMQEQMLQLAVNQDITSMRLVDLANLLGGDIALQRIKHHRERLLKQGLLPKPKDSKKVRVIRTDDGVELLCIPVLGVVS